VLMRFFCFCATFLCQFIIYRSEPCLVNWLLPVA
jgi:hypothetical protein